ncbi:MAG: universal stress protein [Xanthomonadaceae bacterium]|jgi:nucleotide-binding universal stress UspA family protein|nr:universal stress protein [Xanthomonadaceae bacterium]
MFQRILIATDGSRLAGKGVDEGVKLAAQLKAQVVFLFVTEPWAPGFDEAVAWSPNSIVLAEYEKANNELAGKVLGVAEAKAEAAGVARKTLHLSDRYAADAIIETSSKENIDLVVMASHGRRGLGKILLGSQTQMVLTHSKIPVLVIR